MAASMGRFGRSTHLVIMRRFLFYQHDLFVKRA